MMIDDSWERAEPADVRLRNLLQSIIDCEPDESAGDGITVLDAWRQVAREILSRPAQPEEAAQRADFWTWLREPESCDCPEDVLDAFGSDEEHRLYHAWAASQRATPSAPTPNDEERAALADPSGAQEAR